MKTEGLPCKRETFFHDAGKGRIEWSMKKFIWRAAKRGISLLLTVLVLLCGARVGIDGEGMIPMLTVRREEEGLWSIWISPNISELTDGDPLALLVEVVAPDGWRITHVTAGKGAEGLVLTCGSVTDKGGRILLDGVSTGEDAGPILLIYGEKIPLFSAEQGGYMGVTGVEGGEICLFVLKNGGVVEEIPVAVVWEDTYEKPAEAETDSEDETAGETVRETETAEIPVPEDEESGVFLGCRETAAVGGAYTVQLLFRGGSGPTLLYAEGGGVIYAAWERVEDLPSEGGEGVFSCTLRGLLEDRSYVFWVRRGEAWVSVTYTAGVFEGFETVET